MSWYEIVGIILWGASVVGAFLGRAIDKLLALWDEELAPYEGGWY